MTVEEAVKAMLAGKEVYLSKSASLWWKANMDTTKEVAEGTFYLRQLNDDGTFAVQDKEHRQFRNHFKARSFRHEKQTK